ncbi:MAG: hypothetical protein AAGG38_13795, partial [Planctomycetota bacterium]
MAKARTQFLCRQCGAIQPRWMGKCPDCGEWDALEEVKQPGKAAQLDPHRGLAPPTQAGQPEAKPITAIVQDDALAPGRLPTGIAELDRVLGGTTPTPTPAPAPGQHRRAGGASHDESPPQPPPAAQRSIKTPPGPDGSGGDTSGHSISGHRISVGSTSGGSTSGGGGGGGGGG